MAKVCDICEKGYLKANQVPRGVGRRVTRRTTIKQNPNLRTKKFIIDGTAVTLRICASCLKRIKMESVDRELSEAAIASAVKTATTEASAETSK
jgi:ribosomal protein L28